MEDSSAETHIFISGKLRLPFVYSRETDQVITVIEYGVAPP